MSRKAYTAKMPWGDSLTISADLSEASGNIAVVIDGDEDRVAPTPYQTADARHRAKEAMMLAITYCGREWYANPNDTRDSADILKEIESKIVVESDAHP